MYYYVSFAVIIINFLFRDVLAGSYSGIREAFDNKLISVSALAKGGHTGHCMEMEIKNISYDTVFLRLEAGRMLIADDSVYQNILVTGADSFYLVSGQSVKKDISGMCMEMKDRSPLKGAKFTVGDMASKALQEVAQFIGKHHYYNGTGQHAVWALSDKIPLESVHADDDPLLEELHRLLHRLTGKPVPWYTLEYRKDTAHLFSGEAVKLFAKFHYYLQNNGMASLIIYDEKKKAVHTFFENQPHHTGDHEYVFALDVSLWKRGKYFCKLIVDDRQAMVREITL